MKLIDHLDKDNLHHAYLIEGARDEIVPELFEFFDSLNIKISGNPDFCHIATDSFKIDEAFDMREMAGNKSFSGEKRIFVLSVNHFTLDAQNVLLKIFEEPIENIHFFVIIPDLNILLRTLVSRFYVISEKNRNVDRETAKKFIYMSKTARIDFIKNLLTEEDDEDKEGGIIAINSARARALHFLNGLESLIHAGFTSDLHKNTGIAPEYLVKCSEHIFRVREFVRMPGSSIKTLMESVALAIPEKI